MKKIFFLLIWIIYAISALGIMIFVIIEACQTNRIDSVGIFISLFSLLLVYIFFSLWKIECNKAKKL